MNLHVRNLPLLIMKGYPSNASLGSLPSAEGQKLIAEATRL